MPVAKQIIDEQSTHYLVDWEDDIITGTKYHSSWVIKLAINPEMIQAWEQVKVASCATEQDHRAQQTDLGLMNFNGQSLPYQPHWDPYSASQLTLYQSREQPQDHTGIRILCRRRLFKKRRLPQTSFLM